MTPGHVADRSITAAGWMAAGTFLRAVLQVAAQVTFARVLGPDHFGVFLLASLAVSLSALFADIGMSYALIQKKVVTDRDIRYSFTWHLLVAGLVSALLATAAPLVAAWFDDARIAPVLSILAVTLVINAAGIPAMNMLRRELNFRAIQLALLVSYLVGYVVVGIPAVLLDAGIWAPVIAWLVQSSLNTLFLYAQNPHAVRPLLKSDEGGWFLGYSATFLATNLTNWALTNTDRILLGRLAGTSAVGLYATPYNLLNSPTLLILNTAQSILFSASSRLQENLQEMRRAYLAILAAVAILVAPVFAGVSAAAATLIEVLYGPAWAPAADVTRALALAMPVYLVWALSTPILWNTGQKTREFKNQLPLIPLWVLIVWHVAQEGIVALAWSLLAMQVVRALSTTIPAAKALGLTARDYFSVLKIGVVVSSMVMLLVAAIDAAMHSVNIPIPLILAADVIVAAMCWLMLLRIFSSYFHPDFRVLLNRTLARLPVPVARLLTATVFTQPQS